MKMKFNVKQKYLKLFLIILIIFFTFTFTINNSAHKFEKFETKNSYLPFIRPMGYVYDKSSIYNPYMVTDLLIELSKHICRIGVTNRISSNQYQNILADCLSNLKNDFGRWGNNMKYFWNKATDLVKNNNDNFIVERTFAEAFAMVANRRVRSPYMTGQYCGKMFVMNFNAEKAKSVIRHFLRRFNLTVPKKRFITSFIGVHRNWARPDFFRRLNRSKKLRRLKKLRKEENEKEEKAKAKEEKAKEE